MIPFRKQRVATSVVNRIMNIWHELPPIQSPQTMTAGPDPVPAGQAIDAGLSQPAAPVTAEPELAEEIALADMLQGP